MDTITYQNNRNHIRFLFLIAAPIYFFAGYFMLLGRNSDSLDYIRFAATSCLFLVFAGILSIKRLERFSMLPSILSVTGTAIATANVLFQRAEHSNTPLYFLNTIIILSAAIGNSYVVAKPLARLNIIITILLFLAQALRAESLQELSIFGPIFIFLIWQTVMVLRMINLFDQTIRSKQIQAYQSTIVTLNHEFNNVNTICLFAIQIMKTKNSAPSSQDLEMLEESLLRMSELIKKVSNVKDFKETTYVTDGPQMVVLE